MKITEFPDLFNNLTINTVVQISVNKKIEFDTAKAAKYMAKTATEKITQAFDAIYKDTTEAALGLNPETPTSMMRFAGQVSLKYEAVQWAKEILEHAKVEDRQ